MTARIFPDAEMGGVTANAAVSGQRLVRGGLHCLGARLLLTGGFLCRQSCLLLLHRFHRIQRKRISNVRGIEEIGGGRSLLERALLDMQLPLLGTDILIAKFRAIFQRHPLDVAIVICRHVGDAEFMAIGLERVAHVEVVDRHLFRRPRLILGQTPFHDPGLERFLLLAQIAQRFLLCPDLALEILVQRIFRIDDRRKVLSCQEIALDDLIGFCFLGHLIPFQTAFHREMAAQTRWRIPIWVGGPKRAHVDRLAPLDDVDQGGVAISPFLGGSAGFRSDRGWRGRAFLTLRRHFRSYSLIGTGDSFRPATRSVTAQGIRGGGRVN